MFEIHHCDTYYKAIISVLSKTNDCYFKKNIICLKNR